MDLKEIRCEDRTWTELAHDPSGSLWCMEYSSMHTVLSL